MAQSMEHVEYFLARLPMRRTGALAMCRNVNNCVLRKNGPAGGTPGKAHLFFDGRTKVLDQMKPIGDLPGLRRAFRGGLRIKAAAVPADDCDGRTVMQPLCGTLDATVIQYVDNRATLKVDYYGYVARRQLQSSIPTTRISELR